MPKEWIRINGTHFNKDLITKCGFEYAKAFTNKKKWKFGDYTITKEHPDHYKLKQYFFIEFNGEKISWLCGKNQGQKNYFENILFELTN